MAEKSTFVDTIQEATLQRLRRIRLMPRKSAVEDKPRMGRWPPPRQAAWRLGLLRPWREKE
jgi:hypothetical protein